MPHHSLPESSPITRDAAGCAVDALLAFLRASAKQRKAQLFEHDDLLYLHLNLRRLPSTSRLNPLRIPLPHSLHPLDRSCTSLCLIANDSTADAARSTAAAENLPFESVIPLSQLRTDYVPFESRRRLCDSYDIFFAERRILPLLPRLVGNYFFRKKKIPLAVDISRKGWPEAVRQACRSTLLYLWDGDCCGLKVGRISMDREQIVDNLMAAIEGAVELVPKKWANVRSMYIKAVQSVSLPIYQVIPEIGMKIDVAPLKKEEPLDGAVVQERDGKKGVEKKNRKKGSSKKRKVRIHDVDYLGVNHEGRNEEENGDIGVEEQESGELGVNKKSMKKKEGKGKLSKGKKGRTAGDDEDGGEFIELGGEKKQPKRAKKIVNSEVEDCGKVHGSAITDEEVNTLNINAAAAAAAADDDDEGGDDHGDGEELQLKKRGKNNRKRSKGKKGKKDSLPGSSEGQVRVGVNEVVNVMNAAAAAADGDNVVDEDLDVEKSVKKSRKIVKDKKGKNGVHHGCSEDQIGIGKDGATKKKKKSKAMKSEDVAVKKVKRTMLM